jgi:hypothetical protein
MAGTRFDSLAAFRSAAGGLVPGGGAVCLILSEDGVELDGTIRHHIARGFARIVVLAADSHEIAPALEDRVIRVRHDMGREGAPEEAVNTVIGAAPAGTWMAYVFNAEYLFFPFCEDRSIGELCAFCAEERRDSVLSYVVDLYAPDLAAHPDGVAPGAAHFDRTGYYALVRAGRNGEPKERQLDFHGGLKWRFEEHVPKDRRRIDRVAIFRTKPGLALLGDHRFSEEEYNTYACPWHNSPTAVVASFRTAKALRRNPASRHAIGTFAWPNTAPFDWSSRQLLDLGLMEPGQWF